MLLPLAAIAVMPLSATEPATVTVRVADGQAEFHVGSELAGRYHAEPSVAKPYLWPLNGPGGVPVTRAWPMVKGQTGETTDHVHQKSAWFCHGDVIPEGVTLHQKVKNVEGVDFWDEAKGHGVIACVELTPAGDHAIRTRNEWRTADGDKIMDESRAISLRTLGDAHLWVFEIDLRPTVAAVTFGDTKEGAFGVRVSDQLRVGDKKVVNPQSKITIASGAQGEKDCWGHRSPWCDYSGVIDGKPVGIAIFEDPSNPPACWHVRNYGLMAANPFGRSKSGFPEMKDAKDLLRLGKDDHLKLRYGIYVHAGDVKEGKVVEGFERFVKQRD
jgi:hypothetical protein